MFFVADNEYGLGPPTPRRFLFRLFAGGTGRSTAPSRSTGRCRATGSPSPTPGSPQHDTATLALTGFVALARARGKFLFTIAPADCGAGTAAAPGSGTRSRRALAGGRRRRFRFALCAVGSGMELARSGRALMRSPGGGSYGVVFARSPLFRESGHFVQPSTKTPRKSATSTQNSGGTPLRVYRSSFPQQRLEFDAI
jgi:hypothetical protein